MFDRIDYPARGRAGGGDGGPTRINRDDGTTMKGKGKQFVPHGAKVVMVSLAALVMAPQKIEKIKHYQGFGFGYISAQSAERDYGLSKAEITDILTAAQKGEMMVWLVQ